MNEAIQDDPNKTATNSPILGSIALFQRWWRVVVRSDIHQLTVIEKIREDSGFTPRYAFMICMSAGIAILGLLLSSPAVVIGAMLLSPLMGPIMGAGFALAIGDSAWLRESVKAIVLGTIVAVAFAALVVTLSPLQTVTSEIASRTRPSLFDLVVALFSALAGAYAMIRGREGTIVGVAIATALMPPLAVVGFGMATFNMSVFSGSLMLFFTNLMTIALTAAVMARLYGFRSTLSERQSHVQIAIMILVFIGLAVPLGYSLQQIAWEANISRQANGYIKDQFGSKARVSGIDIKFDTKPILITATVFTPTIMAGASEQSSRILSRTFNRDITVSIEQYKVETGSDASSAELDSAREREQQQLAEIQIDRLRDSLALIAGVPEDDVVVDTEKRRAIVTATPLVGAGLETYQALENRVSNEAKGWTIRIKPPARALPPVTLREGEIDPVSQRQIDLAIWAAQRVDLPLSAQGSEANLEKVKAIFVAKNIPLSLKSAAGDGNSIAFNWISPQDIETQGE